MSYHVDIVPNQTDKPAILFRQAWREGKRIRRKTLANLSRMPPEFIDALRALLKGAVIYPGMDALFWIRRALPHGHVAAVLGTCRRIGLPRLLHREASRHRDLALAAIVSRILVPGSKLVCARQLSPETAGHTLGALLGTGTVRGNEMLDMLDWLAQRQRWIEQSLARRHLHGGTLILYDVSSSYLEGRCCPLAAFGHNRDGKKGKQQIVYGLLCSAEGCPVAVEVFDGNTGDPTTVDAQVKKIQRRFGIDRVALVGDRGMLTTARIREHLVPAGLDWVSSLKSADIRRLLACTDAGVPPLRPDELVPDAVAQIVCPEFPGERLLVCLNPRLREERARKREALLEATEELLVNLQNQVRRKGSRLRGAATIGRRVGREANRRKVEKHFHITITDDDLTFSRKPAQIDAETRLDGIYVVRTSLDADALPAEQAVWAYKRLARVERAFRNLKTGHLEIRPLYLYNPTRVRAHVFLCMLSLYVLWHMRRALAPLLFEDEHPGAARDNGATLVARASEGARRKAASKITEDGTAVSSFDTLLDHLASMTLNEVVMPSQPNRPFTLLAEATPLQQRALELLDLDLNPDVAISLTP